MDEGTLNDLLECSVCLERLDTSSKVLPCQHTFCRKCLEEIVERHKELRCPECRVLIITKIDELPPNVLLMRILEGMKNAIPKKQQRNSHPQQIHQNSTPVHQNLQPDHRHKSNKPAHHYLQPHQPYAKALYDYTSKEPGDLNFKHGDLIILRKRIDSNWYQGESSGKQGVFPISYVQIITPVPSHIPQCKALYDFRMTNDEEEGCLAFNKGDIINVIRRVDENWAEGKLDGRIGIFPLAFVELNSLARSLMKLSTNAQPGPSKVAPPTPTTEETSPLILADQRRQGNAHGAAQTQPTQNQAVAQVQQAGIPASDSSSTVSSGSSSTTTPNTTSSNNSSSSSTAPSSPASPPPRNQPVPPRNQKSAENLGTPQRQPPNVNPPPRPESHSHQHNREKRHSFTSLTPQHHASNTHRHSAEILSPDTSVAANQAQQSAARGRNAAVDPNPNEQLPAAYIALYPYKPQKSDELELRKGGIYMVTERCQDGWFKGTSNRTQKCGVFPGNYVAVARGAPRSPQTSSSARSSDGSDSNKSVSYTRSGQKSSSPRSNGLSPSNMPPELPPRNAENPAGSSSSSPDIHHHRKSNSLDAGNKGKTGSQTVRERVRCIAPYPPNTEYELELQVGDIIYVCKKRDDGWYKGTQQRTGRTGLFPASFVESF